MVDLFGISLNQTLVVALVKILAVVVVILIVRRLSHRLITKLIRTTIKPDEYVSVADELARENTLISVIYRTFSLIVWVIGIMVILSILGINIAPFLVGSSVLGLGIGLACRSIFEDFLAGVFIIIENQYRKGDLVRINDIAGRVEQVSFRQTVVRDASGGKHYIQHSNIKSIVNRSIDFSNVVLEIKVDRQINLVTIKTIIDRIGEEMAQQPRAKTDILKPIKFSRINNIDDKQLSLIVSGRVKPGRQRFFKGQFNRLLKTVCDDKKIAFSSNSYQDKGNY